METTYKLNNFTQVFGTIFYEKFLLEKTNKINVEIRNLIKDISYNFICIKNFGKDKKMLESIISNKMKSLHIHKKNLTVVQIKEFKRYIKAKKCEINNFNKHICKLSKPQLFIDLSNAIIKDEPFENLYLRLKNINKIQSKVIKSLKNIINIQIRFLKIM